MNNIGTLIIAPIRPQATADTYPSAYALELLGGHKAVATIVARDAIPVERREEGMTCWVIENDTLYVLSGGIANTNWTSNEIDTGTGLNGGPVSFGGIISLADTSVSP